MEHHSFSVQDAIEYGLSKAVLLHNFRFWLGINQRSGECQKAGATWTFLTSERIAAAHAYLSRRSVSRWLDELVLEGAIIRHRFGKACDRTWWYTMPEYMSVNSKFYPQNEKLGEQKHAEANDDAIGQNGQTIGQNGQCIGQSGQSLRSYNKDPINNITKLTISDAQILKNHFDDEMQHADEKTLDECKKNAIEHLPKHWIQKIFRFKGVIDKTEIYDVTEGFLLHVIADEHDAVSRGAISARFSVHKLESKLNGWVSRYAAQKIEDRQRLRNKKTEKKLSPSEKFERSRNGGGVLHHWIGV